jgi:hypothetical protein
MPPDVAKSETIQVCGIGRRCDSAKAACERKVIDDPQTRATPRAVASILIPPEQAVKRNLAPTSRPDCAPVMI